MVYCGKPSKGCSNCRERKIRCDQREPGCGQCKKREQECPGYRNIVDLMFRDESSHVIKKAKAKARRRTFLTVDPDSSSETEASRLSATPEPKSKSLSLITPNSRSPQSPAVSHADWTRDDSALLPSPDSGSWPATPMIAMLYNLHPTSQERGTAYFFSRYVAVDKDSSHQRFDFVYDVWKPASLVPERQVDGVLASMSAVGLVGLANMTRSSEAADAARKAYGTALRLTNQALRDPVEAVKDTTMLAILILSLFEMMTETTPETLQAWQEHVNGATALAKMRGVEQFNTPGGTKMFLKLCQKVMISCIQRVIPMPQTLIDLRKELVKKLKIDDPAWDLVDPVYKVLQTRHDMKKGCLTDVETIVTRLLAIEDEFETILSRFPKEWNYRTVQVTRRHPAIYRGLCHVYPSLYLSSIWNGVRTCRILVLETLLVQILTGVQSSQGSAQLTSSHYAEIYQTCRQKLEQMVEAIMASVPQHIGLVTPRTANNNNLTTPISSVTVRETPSPASPHTPICRISTPCT
ncbi:Sterol uptake control protein 2 [Coniochaeta hoffmannii]|uniref:Sterol uptake control protein 2 n=1 Tax=Coniochaeta hoffmannii TaxID=91930 RepID=A0AA38RX54_9PEZI|nr:Sterol uptake control protein 2 [Coniochaeta hoffmannii]